MTNRYTELGAGICYQRPDGSWADSRAVVSLTADGGAEADEVPHKLRFAPDINTRGSIRMNLPDGKLMSSTPRGLYLYDSSTQKRLLISAVTNATGVVVPPNLVVYSNCFVGLQADLVLKVTPGGLEQDVAIRESLAWIPLADMGFDPKTTVLEAWTEFYASPKPGKKNNVLPKRRTRDGEAVELNDEKLDFGSFIMRPGRAYSTLNGSARVSLEAGGHQPVSVPVGKFWHEAEGGRRFLIESVRWRELIPLFDGLERGAAVNNAAFERGVRSPSPAGPQLPPALFAEASSARMLVAQHAPTKTPAFILDYATLNGSYGSYTFAPDQTYYISGTVYIDNAVFHGGTVIKIAPMETYAGISVGTSARFESGPNRMVLITAKDDDTVGEIISGSSGNPSGLYGNPALTFSSGADPVDMQYVRVSHAATAVWFDNSGEENFVRHCQFVRGSYGINASANYLTLQNVLINNFDSCVAGYSFYAEGQHVTAHSAFVLLNDFVGDSVLTLMNSLVVDMDLGSQNVLLFEPSVYVPVETTPVFQTAGLGAHYLANNSPYRGVGDPNIAPELRAALKQKTTHPPLGLPGGSLTDITLSPQVSRNDGWQPDLGYSYDAMDYLSGGLYMQSSSRLYVTNGAVIGVGIGGITWGIRLASGTKLISEGTPVKPNRFVEMRLIQEQHGSGTVSPYSTIHCEYAGSATMQVQLRFTELLGRAGVSWHIWRGGGLSSITVRDSQMLGGGISGSFADTSAHHVHLINSLFEWSKIVIEAQNGTRLNAEHNTFFNGQLRFIGLYPYDSRFRDNLVDTVNLAVSPLFAITGNGYYQTPPLPGSPPQHTLVSPVNYQMGPLGKFYLPAGSTPLHSGGSQSPAAAGLYHYTTRVTQEKEGSKPPDQQGNIKVDVGYHYVALSSDNLALGKVATQSSTAFGGTANRGNDGNTSGNYALGSVTHTAFQSQPWWQVDLGAILPIRQINIWNRTDCCASRLSNFYIFVSDNPFLYNDVSSTLSQPGVSAYAVWGQAGTPTGVTIARQGRYVRVQLTASQYLSIAELQVLAPHKPVDCDSDSLADYVEDQDGDGITDPTETFPCIADSDGDCIPDWWEVAHANARNAADATADPDSDLLNNKAEYLAGTDPNVPDIGYIPNNKHGQNWPANLPIPAPAVGAPTQEREYKFSFAGLTSVQPNDGVARALVERIDNVLTLLVADRANWAVYAALQPFDPGDPPGVHDIFDPINNANYVLQYRPAAEDQNDRWPTHTAFMDIYFDTENDLNYTLNAEYRMRQRFDNTERWLHHINGGPPPTGPELNNRIEFMSKVDRIYDVLKPGWSEVTESRNRDTIPHLHATGIQGRIDDFQDGRWPEDLELFRADEEDPPEPSPDANKVGNFSWKMREFLVRKLDVPMSFSCQASYAGAQSQAVAAGDFNGDGRADVARADFYGNNVRIYLGNANGTLTLGSTFAVGTTPNAIAVADFNLDQRLDLAVANQFDNPERISVLLGNGDGTFAVQSTYNVGLQPMSIAAGKFNSDGSPDLVVANFDDSNVSVLLNNGNGTFAPRVNYGVGASPNGVTVGDFNGDGRDDIAVAAAGVDVLLANANGTFGSAVTYAAGTWPRSVAAGDLNADGHVDLVAANGSGSTVGVLLGNGNGTFATAVNYTVGGAPDALAVADYNGDRRLDIAANVSGGNISILKGNGNGTFAAVTNFAAGADLTSVAAGDFNADGFPDLAIATFQSANSLKVLLNQAGSDIFKFRPKLVVLSERRRQHFQMPGLLLSFVPGVPLENVFIISVDSAHVYREDELLPYMKAQTSIRPEPVGSFLEVEVEFERDASDKLDDMINQVPPHPDRDELIALRDAFFADQDTIIDAITKEFNEKPHDLTEFYTIKGAGGLVDLSFHATVLPPTGSGVQTGVPGKIGTGLSFNGNGYVLYTAQDQPAGATITVESNPTFVLTEFQSRGTSPENNQNPGENRDAIEDEDGDRNDWIEIQNVTATEQSLNGWYLTDNANNLTRWPFPNVSVPAGGFVIVFADSSPLTPVDAIPPLHANFGISGGGEYLALVKPGGVNIATRYSVPSIPNADYDVSYGIVQNGAEWVEGFFNASPGQPNEGIYRRVPMNLGDADFTISLWLKTSGANVAILSKSDTGGTLTTTEKQLYLADGKVRFYGEGAGTIAGNTAVNNNAWRHIAITYTVSGHVRKVYVDGQDDTDTSGSNFTGNSDAGITLLLGFDGSTQAGGHFTGVMDEVAIWARPLSLAEIQAIYNGGSQNAGVNTRGQIPARLLFHASMDVFLVPQAATKYHQAFDRLP